MLSEQFIYHHDTLPLNGYLSYDKSTTEKRPAVMVVHDWSGVNDFARQKTQWLATQGYVGFAVDMYGHGHTGNTTEEKLALMKPVVDNRPLLRHRILTAFDAIKKMPQVNPNQIAVIGFCFGGLCALDLARTGAAIKGAVSLHGLLNKPESLENQAILAKLLILHGYDDPMVRPHDIDLFCKEMNASTVDWQIHMYSQTQHAFTNPLAHDHTLGTIFNPKSNDRAMESTRYFLSECFKND